MKTNIKQLFIFITCGALLAGCCTLTKKQPAEATTGPDTNPPMAAPSGANVAFFPSGRADCSGLAIEKNCPPQAIVGQPFDCTYKLTNLTDATLENVTVMSRVSSGFTIVGSDPNANNVANNIATWNIGTLGPRESKTITIHGSSANEGAVTTCCWATYNPVLCNDIQIVRAAIALTKSAPADVTICDPIPVTITVQNSGSSGLSGVHVTDNLPNGLLSDGKSTLDFDVGKLAPGESKDLKYSATASAPGKLTNTAKATSAEGVTADASATTSVHQPVLTIACAVPERVFIGRNFDVTWTVTDTGDAPAAGTRVQLDIPQGLTPVSASASGQTGGGHVTWDLGSVEINMPHNITATFVGNDAGTYSFAATASGACAQSVTTSCETRVHGIPAILLEKSDDPDPVAVGDTTTYTVKVTNQGSANDHNVQVVVVVDNQLVPLSTTDGTISGQTVTMPVVPELAPKQSVTYKVVAKGVSPGDAHTRFTLRSDMLSSPISAEESTHVY